MSAAPDDRSRGRGRLRVRVLVIFGIGSIALTSGVAAVTYDRSRDYLLAQRRTYATRQAYANARLVEDLARTAPAGAVPGLLGSLETPAGSMPVLYHDGQWISPQEQGGGEALVPSAVSRLVLQERKRTDRRFDHRGPKLVVGVPLANGDAYFEVFPLTELSRTLRALRTAFLAGDFVTLLGSIALGAWAGRKLLGPVTEIGRTAKAITGGETQRRLDVGGYEEFAELAATFNQMVEHLNDRIEHDTRFASNVSHELRSPLTTLKSAVGAMQARRDRLDDRTARLLDLLTAEVNRFEGLVQDLLEISRGDEVDALRREDITLAELGDLAAEVSGRTDLVVEPLAAAVVVRVDRRRIRRVLANLVRNADSHGGGLVAIRVVERAGKVRIEVEDGGPGVPEGERDRIFERFYRRRRQAGTRGSGDGVGLGLALVADHVRLNAGTVWVEDRDGGGARFVVELPTVVDANDPPVPRALSSSS